MAKLEQVIEEIRELSKETSHRTALRTYNVLESNQKIFLEKVEKENFNFLLRTFSDLSEAPLTSYSSESFLREYRKAFDSLLFHLNRII